MRNKYDITLSEEEKQGLINNITSIKNYLIELVKDFETNIELESEWSFYDNVWGIIKCKVKVEKRTNNVVVATNKVEERTSFNVGGRVGGLGVNFEKDIFNGFTQTYKEYALSLIDNWKEIKGALLSQLNRAKETKQLLKGFEL